MKTRHRETCWLPERENETKKIQSIGPRRKSVVQCLHFARKLCAVNTGRGMGVGVGEEERDLGLNRKVKLRSLAVLCRNKDALRNTRPKS